MTDTLNIILTSMADFRRYSKKYLELIRQGRPVYLTVRGKIVAKVVPVETIDS